LKSSDVVVREETSVVFIRCADEIDAIRHAWARLEAIVPLRGNKFFGTFDGHEYRACAAAEADGLERGVIPGGRYARARLRGDAPAIYEQIGPAVDALEAAVEVDRARPVVEFYRRHDEIDILVPVV
jgi:hypothetical protein